MSAARFLWISRARRPSRRQLSPGFTILEVMIVLVIIGLILGLVGPQIFRQLDKAKAQTAESQIKLLRTALDSYYVDLQRYPTTTEGLTVLIRPSGGKNAQRWSGPYMQDEIPLDPWGNPYVYRVGETRERPFYLFSLGADGKEGGEGNDKDIGLLPPVANK